MIPLSGGDVSPQVAVLYQDGHILVASKPSGLLYHRSGISTDRVFLLQTLRDLSGGEHLYPIQRLDRATSGITILGRSPEMARALTGSLVSGNLRKIYLALVAGIPPQAGIIDLTLKDKESGVTRDALSVFKRLATGPDCSLLVVRPHSGRRHQIRRHLKKIHHPILGDTSYNKGPCNYYWREQGLHRLALHAFGLQFPHPQSGELMTWFADLPPDLTEPLSAIPGINIILPELIHPEIRLSFFQPDFFPTLPPPPSDSWEQNIC